MRQNLFPSVLLCCIFCAPAVMMPAYGQTAVGPTCLAIINDPNVTIPSTVAIGSYGNILAPWDFTNLCDFPILIDNLTFFVATAKPIPGAVIFENLTLASTSGSLGAGIFQNTVAQGYSYALLSGTGIQIPANTTLQVSLIGDVSPNTPSAAVDTTVQVQITSTAGIRITAPGSVTMYGTLAMAPGSPIEIIAGTNSSSSSGSGPIGVPQLTLYAGTVDALTVDTITVSDSSGTYSALPNANTVIPANQSSTFALQNNNSTVTTCGNLAVNALVTVGSNSSDTVQILLTVPNAGCTTSSTSAFIRPARK